MTQDLCTLLAVDPPSVLALAFLAGVVFGGILDHFIFPLVIRAWLALVRRSDGGR